MQKFQSLISKKKKKNNQPTLTIKKCSILSPLHRCWAWKTQIVKASKGSPLSQVPSTSLSLCVKDFPLSFFFFCSDQFLPWFVNSPQTIRRKDRIEFLVNCFLFFILVLGEWKNKGKQMQKLSRMTDVRQSLRDKATRQALSHCERTNMR